MSQYVVYGVLALFVLFSAVRYLRTRSVRRYSPWEVREKLNKNDRILLLDVRTDVERQAQHIKGSLHIPLHALGGKVEELSKYRGREIICYCRSGNRSLTAASILGRRGFAAASMNGGILEWNSLNS